MEHIKIIAQGGESLASLGASSDFPDDVKKLFEDSVGKWDCLDKDDVYFYLDMPVDSESRLFIRAFLDNPNGGRCSLYEVGFLLSKGIYEKVGSLRQLHETLLALPHDMLRQCWESKTELKLDLHMTDKQEDFPCDSDILQETQIYCGKEMFNTHIEELSCSFVKKNIDAWFTKLYFLVNPYKIDEKANVIISRKHLSKPQEPSPIPISQPPKKNFENKRFSLNSVIPLVLAVAIVFYIAELHKKIDLLEQNNAELRAKIDLLKQNNAELHEKIVLLEQDIVEAQGKIHSLD